MPPCSECSNGYACHLCLMLVAPEHCPGPDAFLRGCRHVQLGDMCEGDGGCGTSDSADNCLISPQRGEFLGDVYVRVGCEPDDLPELTWLFFIVFSAMLFGGFCRNWLNQRRHTSSSLAAADGATPVIEMDGVPCGVPVLVPVAEASAAAPPPPPSPTAPSRTAPDSSGADGRAGGAEHRGGSSAVAVPDEGGSVRTGDAAVAAAVSIPATSDPFPSPGKGWVALAARG